MVIVLGLFHNWLFFYLDPPYWQMEGDDVDFLFEQYQLMAEIFSNLKGKVILSINDPPDMRIIFRGFAMGKVKMQYCQRVEVKQLSALN